MPEMSTAIRAMDFGTDHSVAFVDGLIYAIGLGWAVEAWPTGAGIEFRFALKQGLAATCALVGAGGLVIPEFVLEWRFGALSSQDSVSLWGQDLLPLGFGSVQASFASNVGV